MIKHENTTTVIISLQWLLSSCLLFNFGDVCIFKTTISKTNLPHLFTVVTTQSLINCYHTFCLCIIKQEVRAGLKLTWFSKSRNQNAGEKKKKARKGLNVCTPLAHKWLSFSHRVPCICSNSIFSYPRITCSVSELWHLDL